MAPYVTNARRLLYRSPISGSFVQPRADLSDEDASKLGMKNEDDEVEKFVMANTQGRNSIEKLQAMFCI